VPWQNGRVFQSPVGVLTACFLLRPNTMFHPEGEWSTRLILNPAQAQGLRQLVMPAHDDIVDRAKEMHSALPTEQRAKRPFKEHPFWQAGSGEGSGAEDVYFTFRLPTIDRQTSLQAPSMSDLLNKPHRLLAAADPTIEPTALQPAAAVLPFRKPGQEVAMRVALCDAQGEDIKGLTLEPDHWDAVVHFSIQQFWLRSFGAGVTLRLEGVQLIGLRQRQHADPFEALDSPLPIAL